MADDSDPVLTATIDRLATEHGWLLLRPGDEHDVRAVEGDAFVFGAVSWSEWDREAAMYLLDIPTSQVVLFNVDETPTAEILRRLPGVANLPLAIPVVARYVGGRLERVEEGRAAVNWLRELASA